MGRAGIRHVRELRHQWFLYRPITPVGGVITLDDRPGLGMELDESKIEEQRPLSWTQTRWS
jgi:L-alanine-DL-glutamate epimerase-like enolase superfamily enzyme